MARTETLLKVKFGIEKVSIVIETLGLENVVLALKMKNKTQTNYVI